MLQQSFRTSLKRSSLLFAMLVVTFAWCGTAKAQSGTVLHQFKGENNGFHDGAFPAAAVTVGPDGTLYGTTSSGGTSDLCSDGQGDSETCGTVFQIKPPTTEGSPWRESVIYSFGSQEPDGLSPSWASLAMDSLGNLYGTTAQGGISSTICSANTVPYWCGTAFQLVPPRTKGGSWTRNLIYQFQEDGENDGFWPLAGLTLDKKGNLYGTTESDGNIGAGTVFQLSPPVNNGDPWKETILYSFQWPVYPGDGLAPTSSLFMDEKGNLFGTTDEGGSAPCLCGTVFELSPPQRDGDPWEETILYSFQDGSDGSFPNGLIRGADGSFYGTTKGGGGNACAAGWGHYCGTVFKLTPGIGGVWQEAVLYRFKGSADGATPRGNLLFGGNGRLYGTASSGGAT